MARTPVASQRRSHGRVAAASVSIDLRRRCLKRIASAIGSSRKTTIRDARGSDVQAHGLHICPEQEPQNYWRHGHSTERDFIYVTTQSLTHDALKKLSEEVGPERTLLGLLQGVQRARSGVPESDHQEDSADRADQVRMGTRRLQLARCQPAADAEDRADRP